MVVMPPPLKARQETSVRVQQIPSLARQVGGVSRNVTRGRKCRDSGNRAEIIGKNGVGGTDGKWERRPEELWGSGRNGGSV